MAIWDGCSLAGKGLTPVYEGAEHKVVFVIRDYTTVDGQDLFLDWIEKLRDKKAKVAISARLARLVEGNFGDHKFVGEGLWELRFFLGPGYRIYYALQGDSIVLLLCAGDKSSQVAALRHARQRLEDWNGRIHER